MVLWGRLLRVGGEDSTSVPSNVQLAEPAVFFGRVSKLPVPVPAVPVPVSEGAAPQIQVQQQPPPAAAASSVFSHKQQVAIQCVYISSTHFCLSVHYEAPAPPPAAAPSIPLSAADRSVELLPRYRIEDFSRNGTFLNGELVGMNNALELKSGDEVSLRYKGKIMIVYKFHVEEMSSVAQSNGINPTPTKRSAQQEQVPTPVLGNPASSSKNSLAEQLAQQLSVLQEEANASNQRIANQSEQIASLTQELERVSKKLKNEERVKEDSLKLVEDLREQLHDRDSNQAALEARILIVQGEQEEYEQQCKELKSKLVQFQEELKEKSTQVEKRSALLEESNKALLSEQSIRQNIEDEWHQSTQRLSSAEEKITYMTSSIRDLQIVKANLEREVSESKEHCDVQSRFITQMKKKYEDQDQLSKLCFQQYNQVIESMSVFDKCMKGLQQHNSHVNGFISEFKVPDKASPVQSGINNKNGEFPFTGVLKGSDDDDGSSPSIIPSVVHRETTQSPEHDDRFFIPSTAIDEFVHHRRKESKRAIRYEQDGEEGYHQKRNRLQEDDTVFEAEEGPIEPVEIDDNDNHEMVFECTQVPFSQAMLDDETMIVEAPLERRNSKVDLLEPPFRTEDLTNVSMTNVDLTILSQNSIIPASSSSLSQSSKKLSTTPQVKTECAFLKSDEMETEDVGGAMRELGYDEEDPILGGNFDNTCDPMND